MRWFIKALGVVLMAALPACGNAQSNQLIPSLQRLADANNAEAIYYLGMAYQTGSGVAQDPAKALYAFRRAAALGDPLASYKVGCYFDGQGAGLVTRDAAQALKYKLVAAEAGYALAQQDVAALYADSGALPQALAWLERSAAQGWSGGLMTIASVYNGSPGVDPDSAKTAAYFQLYLDRADADQEQVDWLARFNQGLTEQDKEWAAAIVKGFRAKPTELTVRALSGQRAAQALVDRAR